jgi:hypothetical protein
MAMNPSAHPAAHAAAITEQPSVDLEKAVETVDISSSESDGTTSPIDAHIPVPSKFRQWNTRIENLAGLEARGITRVLPEERQAASLMNYMQMVLLWFSANITVNNLAVGLLGPLVFQLGFVDCALTAVFGTIVGSASTAYMSTWGAESGNRTMV